MYIYTSRLHSLEYFGYSLNIIVIEKGFSYLKKILPVTLCSTGMYRQNIVIVKLNLKLLQIFLSMFTFNLLVHVRLPLVLNARSGYKVSINVFDNVINFV